MQNAEPHGSRNNCRSPNEHRYFRLEEQVGPKVMSIFFRRRLLSTLSSPICLQIVKAGYQTAARPILSDGMPPPLRGIKILDLTRVLAGPTTTMVCPYSQKLLG